MINDYHPISHDEQIQLLTGLFKQYKVQFDEDDLKDFVACTDFETIEAYMDDIGIVITHDKLGISASMRSLNNDTEWMTRKLKTLWGHFNS